MSCGHREIGVILPRARACLMHAFFPRFLIEGRRILSRTRDGIAAILAMDSPDASSRTIGRPSGLIWRKEAGKDTRDAGRAVIFFSAAQDEDCWFCSSGNAAVVNAPGAAKGGCCFLGTGRSPGSGDCVVISLHLRLLGPTSWKTEWRKGARDRGKRKKERDRVRPRARARTHTRTHMKGGRAEVVERAQYYRRCARASVGARCPIQSHSDLASRGSHIGERERERECADVRWKVHARTEDKYVE